LLYYCDRPGWALVIGEDLDKQLTLVRSQGAKHLVVTGLELLEDHPTVRATLERLKRIDHEMGYRIYELAGE